MQRTYPKRRKYNTLPYSMRPNVPNYTRPYNVHHSGSPRRFIAPENNRPRNSPEMRNGDGGLSSPRFYHLSPKYQRKNINDKPNRQNNEPYWLENLSHEPSEAGNPQSTVVGEKYTYSPGQTRRPYWADTVGRNASPKLIHVSEKRPTRQTKEPYWMEDFEHYELGSNIDDLQETDFAQPPIVHRELSMSGSQCERSLSYRFPNQDPQCVSSLKRKHPGTTTSHTKKTKLKSSESKSTFTKKTECSNEATNQQETTTQSSSKTCEESKDTAEDSSQCNSIVATYDGNGNFIVVSKASSTACGSNQSNSFLDRFENDPEEDDIELVSIDNQKKLGKDKLEEQQSGLIEVESNDGSNSQLSKESEVEKSETNNEVLNDTESLKTCTKAENDETESLSEAESEVFDDIFLKTISKELENDAHWSEELPQAKESADGRADYNDDDPSPSEGSISPTFDSTLLRYLDDNIRNGELSARAKEVGVGDKDHGNVDEEAKRVDDSYESVNTFIFPETDHERSVLGDELASDGDTKEVNEQSAKSCESSQICIGTTIEKNDSTVPGSLAKDPDSEGSQQRIDEIEENKKGSSTLVKTSPPQKLGMAETKNECDTIPKISEEKSAETLLEFHQEFSSNTKIATDTSLDEMPLSQNSDQLFQNSQTEDKISLVSTASHPVEGTDEVPMSSMASCENVNDSSSKDKTKSVCPPGNLNTDVRGVTTSFDQEPLSNRTDSCETIVKSEILSCEQSNNMPEVAPTLETSGEKGMNVDEAIKIIREKCEGTVEKIVKQFESMVNKPAEEGHEMTATEVDKMSKCQEESRLSEEDNSSFDMSNSSIEDHNSSYVPLCENLLQSVKQELHRKEEESKTEKNQVSKGDNSCDANVDSSEDVNNQSRNVSFDTSENKESSTYNMLHSAVLASKKADLNIPRQLSNDNEDVSSRHTGKPGMSDIDVAKVLVSKTLSEKPKPVEEAVSMSKATEFVEGIIKDPETCNNPDEKKTSQISNAAEEIEDIGINYADVPNDSMAEKSKPLVLEEEITLFSAKELKEENCNPEGLVDTTTVLVESIAKKDPDICQTHGLGIHDASIEVESKMSSSPDEMASSTSEKNTGSDVESCDQNGAEIESANTKDIDDQKSKVVHDNPDTSKSLETAIMVKRSLHIEETCIEADAGSKPDNEIPSQICEATVDGAEHLTEDLQMLENFGKAEPIISELEGEACNIDVEESQVSNAAEAIEDIGIIDADVPKDSMAEKSKPFALEEEITLSKIAMESKQENCNLEGFVDTATVVIKGIAKNDADICNTNGMEIPNASIEVESRMSSISDKMVSASPKKNTDSDVQNCNQNGVGIESFNIKDIDSQKSKVIQDNRLNDPGKSKNLEVAVRVRESLDIEENNQSRETSIETHAGSKSDIEIPSQISEAIDEGAKHLTKDLEPENVELAEPVISQRRTSSNDTPKLEALTSDVEIDKERVREVPTADVQANRGMIPNLIDTEDSRMETDDSDSNVVCNAVNLTEDEKQHASGDQEKAVAKGINNSRVTNSSASNVVKDETQEKTENENEKVVVKEIFKSCVANSSTSNVTEDGTQQATRHQEKAVTVKEIPDLLVVGSAATTIEDETFQVSEEGKQADVEHENISKSDSSVAELAGSVDRSCDKGSLIAPLVSKEEMKVDVEHKNISKSQLTPSVVFESKVHSDIDAVEDKISLVSKEMTKVEDKKFSTSDSSETVAPKLKLDQDTLIKTSKPFVESSRDKMADKKSDCNDDPVKSNESKSENDCFARMKRNDENPLVIKLHKRNKQAIETIKTMISKLLEPKQSKPVEYLCGNDALNKCPDVIDKVDESSSGSDFVTTNDEDPSGFKEVGLPTSIPPSPDTADNVMTDSEHSSASSDDTYVQSLLAKARRLSDIDTPSFENSDVETGRPSGLSEIQEGSHDTELAEEDCTLKKSIQKYELEKDRNESSNVQMDGISHTPETQETDVSQNELGKVFVSKKPGEKSDTEMSKTSSESSVVETCTKSGTRELTKGLELIRERLLSLPTELKQTLETVCSTQERQTTGASKDQSSVSRRASIKERKEVSHNIKEVYNGTYVSACDKEVSKLNNETFTSRPELLLDNKNISKNTNDRITAGKRGRPPKRSYVMLAQTPDNQKDVSDKKTKRRSPRKRKTIHGESDGVISSLNLCSRAIPYRRNMFKKRKIGRSKSFVKLEKDYRVNDRQEFNVDEVIDILDVSDDANDFHLRLDDEEENSHNPLSPEQVYHLICASNGKVSPGNSSRSKVSSLKTANLPASRTKLTNKEAVRINRTSSSTRGETEERPPHGSLPQRLDNSVPGTISEPANSSQGGALPDQLSKSLTIPRIMSDATPAKNSAVVVETNSLKSSLVNQLHNSPSNSSITTPRRSTCTTSLRKESSVSDSTPLSSFLGSSSRVDSNENTSRTSLAHESSTSDSYEDRSSTQSKACVSLATAKPDQGRFTGKVYSLSEMTRDKGLSSLSGSERPSDSTSNGRYTNLGTSKPSATSQSSDANPVPNSPDICISNGPPLPTSLSQTVDDGSSSSGYSSTAMMDSQESATSTESNERNDTAESLKITLISETDPHTGKTNWTQGLGKLKEIVKKEASAGYGLRPSKTRKTKNPSPVPTDPNAKRRRITITDLRSETQSPQPLHHLSKRPLEEYIRSVEKVYRAADKNSKKGLLSIAMNDHVSKTVCQDQEGDYLQLGDTDVMYEIVKKAYGESKFKPCRPSLRSLYFSAKQGNALQVLVLAAGCNVNATIPQEKHKTAMHAAAGAGHVDILRLLSMIGGNLSCLDTKLQTPLFDAVENQQTEVVKYLLNQDVNLNLKDSQGMTVLHVAAQKSNLEIINLLMETRKMNVNEQDNGGWTALMWTAEGMRMDVARCLLKWGADVNILDREQNTCLHWAALAGDTEIMDLLLKSNVHIDARNMFGATALHISAREKKLPNIKTLEKYRPNMEIVNAEGKRALDLVPFNSKCYRQLKRMEMLMSLAKRTLKERLISRDISRGQEKRPIPCINEVDDENLPDDFVYVSNNLESKSEGFDRSMTSCNCSDGCINDKQCECAQLSTRKRFWYDETGCINSEIFDEDRPLVYECNMKCKCWSNCRQRVVQNGITAGLQLYKTEDKGWAVRTQASIPKGMFVCEYIGEILSDSDADKREDDCYLFDLDVKGQQCTLFCLDAKFYGNITRFINHSCDPNILPVRVFTDHQVKSRPRIAFFAARDIKPYEEICSNYGEKFWTVKKSEFHCVCNTRKCKYGEYKK